MAEAQLNPPPALTRHVRDLWPEIESLLDAGQDVESVRHALGWAHVELLIEAEIATVQRGLEQHAAAHYSHPELTWALGRLSGLKALAEASDAIVESASRTRRQQAERHEREGAAEALAVEG